MGAFCYNALAMEANPVIKYLPALLVQALLLMVISRTLFRALVMAFGTRGGGGIVTFLRIVGNIIHETSHALGYLLFGYLVKHIVFCALDPQRTGVCVRGRPWSRFALPWLADGAAALMPLIIGSVALAWVGRLLGVIDYQAMDVGGTAMLRAVVDQALALLGSLDWSRWQTYLFLYLALSISAEVSPSHTDVRYSLPALAAVAVIAGLLVFSAQHAQGLNELLTRAGNWMLPGIEKLFAVWSLALVLMLLVSAVVIPVTFVIQSLRPDTH
ncbi:MAG TPA: hypothetical protein DGT21_07945 [Armatimonadetes bacterium]|nr:hypothetical protein [Armatimonadota bacterium]